MSIQNRWFLCAAALFAGLCHALALSGTPPVLTNAITSGDQFQFTLRGQTNVIYVIETSSDLRTWTPALTNSDPHATRTVTVSAMSGAAFWRVHRAPAPLFSHAVAARGTVNLGGSGLIDSFDSADANYSTAGQYDPSKNKDGGHIASTLATNGTVSIGNMDVAGVVSTGPGGTVTVGPVGGVGSFAWLSNPVNDGSIEPGYHREDMNFAFASARLPANFNMVVAQPLIPFAAPGFNVGGTNYKYAVFMDGDYKAPYISLRTGEKMLVRGNARLWVQGFVLVQQSTSHILIDTNASLEMYVGGVVDISGGACVNASQLANNFSIIVLSSASVNYGGNGKLVGTIYAPLSSVALNGTSDAIGAVVCNNFTLSGTMGIHFDENLMRVGPWR
jgi:hypothetical protein